MYTLDVSVVLNAYNPKEVDSIASAQMMRLLVARQIRIFAPTLILVEAAGVISRIRGDVALAEQFADTLQRLPTLTLLVLDQELTHRARRLAAQHRLRGADAVYAAVAQQTSTTLVSLDKEHLSRLHAVIPTVTSRAVLAQLYATPPPPFA